MVRDLWKLASICERKHVQLAMHGALVMPVKAVARVVPGHCDSPAKAARRPTGAQRGAVAARVTPAQSPAVRSSSAPIPAPKRRSLADGGDWRTRAASQRLAASAARATPTPARARDTRAPAQNARTRNSASRLLVFQRLRREQLLRRMARLMRLAVEQHAEAQYASAESDSDSAEQEAEVEEAVAAETAAAAAAGKAAAREARDTAAEADDVRARANEQRAAAAADVWNRARARAKAARAAAVGLGSAQKSAPTRMEEEATSPVREKRKGGAASGGTRAMRLRTSPDLNPIR